MVNSWLVFHFATTRQAVTGVQFSVLRAGRDKVMPPSNITSLNPQYHWALLFSYRRSSSCPSFIPVSGYPVCPGAAYHAVGRLASTPGWLLHPGWEIAHLCPVGWKTGIFFFSHKLTYIFSNSRLLKLKSHLCKLYIICHLSNLFLVEIFNGKL